MFKKFILWLFCVINKPLTSKLTDKCLYCGYNHREIIKRRAAENIPAGSVVSIVEDKVKVVRPMQGIPLGVAKRNIEAGDTVLLIQYGNTEDVMGRFSAEIPDPTEEQKDIYK